MSTRYPAQAEHLSVAAFEFTSNELSSWLVVLHFNWSARHCSNSILIVMEIHILGGLANEKDSVEIHKNLLAGCSRHGKE